jgi:hypothetical protein
MLNLLRLLKEMRGIFIIIPVTHIRKSTTSSKKKITPLKVVRSGKSITSNMIIAKIVEVDNVILKIFIVLYLQIICRLFIRTKKSSLNCTILHVLKKIIVRS